ncbi:MAG: UMP kinase [Ignavibacteria bacterium]|nr:UMP kinase [Ignavibacteria bacterium]
MENKPIYRRILLKLSGEALMGSGQFGIDPSALNFFAFEVKAIHDLGVQVGIVIGGGNIFRGIQSAAKGIDKVSGDYMGMLATVINSLAFQCALEALGLETRLQTAITMTSVAEPYIRRKAIRHLEKGRVVIFGGGTGLPNFTTDTTAVLRAIDIGADLIVKGTKVDGIFDSDPMKNPEAKLLKLLTFNDAIIHNLAVMDQTAFTLCRDHKIPIVVLNINKQGNLLKLVQGESIGSLVTS